MNPKKPIALARLEGNPGKRRLPTEAEEVKVESGMPEVPDWLDKDARVEWRRLAPELLAVGLLGKVDRLEMALLCQTASSLAKCQTVLNEKGHTYRVKGSIRKRPEVAMVHEYTKLLNSIAGNFGLHPSARARMSVPGKKSPSPMASLIGKN